MNIKADEKARVQTKSGGSFEYSYAGLGAYLALVRPIWAKFKLFTMQGVEIKQVNNAWVLELETRVGHESGQWTSSTTNFPVPTDPQQAGSSSAICDATRWRLSWAWQQKMTMVRRAKAALARWPADPHPLPSYAGSHDDLAAVGAAAAATSSPATATMADPSQPNSAPA